MERIKAIRGAASANGNGSQLTQRESAVCHEALFADTMCFVMLIDRAGRVIEMNDGAREAIGDHAAGCTLFDVLPEKVARERLGLMQRALEEGNVLRVEGMMWGTMRRCTYRPLEHSVLVTSCPMVLHEHQRDETSEIVRAKHDDLGVLISLTEREMEVMALIGEGLSTNDIAKRLHRSEKTVEWHRASLGHKLGVTNRVELARIALRAGLCPLPEGFEGRVEAGAGRDVSRAGG